MDAWMDRSIKGIHSFHTVSRQQFVVVGGGRRSADRSAVVCRQPVIDRSSFANTTNDNRRCRRWRQWLTETD